MLRLLLGAEIVIVNYPRLKGTNNYLPHAVQHGSMLTDDYIAWFFDGEGCVILQIHKDKRGKGHSYLEPQVCITSCNKEILEEIKTYMGCGKIWENDNHRRGNNHCYKLFFMKQQDMLAVLKRLHPMLRIKRDASDKVINFIESKQEKTKK